ncbi:hypothetical protein EDB85DRAFT_2170442 [Lactarius pseudohatsudake]|nr:hypothetical protein EDB85DRAFT_2170442 [Lactarius pseudohatsudake]
MFGVGTKLGNQSVAQIVISTAPHESQTLSFNDASFPLNNSFFFHHLKPPTAPAQNHESALTDKPLNPERTQTLASVIATQLGSLADLKTYVAAAAQGTSSGGGTGGFVWLVTDALGRLGIVATYGAELGGVYQPAPPPSSSSGRALSTSARTFGSVRPTNVWSDPPLAASDAGAVAGSNGMYGTSEAPAALDALWKTLYPLFYVSVHEHAWMAVGYGVWRRETYLERFWTCLDWAAVQEAYAWYAVRK